MNRITAFAMALLLLPIGSYAGAQTLLAQEAFVGKLAAGINARNVEAIKPLLHPASSACRTAATLDYDRWLLWKDGGGAYTIAAPVKLKTEAALPNAGNGSREEALKNKAPFYWPAPPEASLRLSYHSAAMSITERVFEVTGQGDAMRLVLPCPTELGLKAFAEQKARYATREKKLTRFWNGLSPTDRQALILMAQQGMKLDGMRMLEQKYRFNTSESLALMDRAQYADTP